jgi:hypothetical protein
MRGNMMAKTPDDDQAAAEFQNVLDAVEELVVGCVADGSMTSAADRLALLDRIDERLGFLSSDAKSMVDAHALAAFQEALGPEG